MSKVMGKRASTLPGMGRDDQWRLFLGGEVTRNWTPDRRNINIAYSDGMNNLRQRMVVAIVAVHHVPTHVSYNPALGERMRRRRVHAVVANELDADRARLEARIVDGGDRRFAGLGDEHIRRSIVRTGCKRHGRAQWDSSDKIAFASIQALAHESAPLGAPHKLQRSMEIASNEAYDLVLEPFPRGIGIGKIVRVCADP